MFDKIVNSLLGIVIIWTGIDILRTGKYIVWEFQSEYGNSKIPAGIAIIICGLVLIIFSLWKKKKQ